MEVKKRVIPAQAGIQGGGSRGAVISEQSCVPPTHETNMHVATSIPDSRRRGSDEGNASEFA